jgi:hypothetical protein
MNVTVSQKKLQIKKQKDNLLSSSGTISITKLLESDQIQDIICQCREFRERIFSPLVTVLLFVKQMLSPDKSCKQAVANFAAEQCSEGNDNTISSTNTGPYCKARQRLPEETVHQLVKETGKIVSQNASLSWKIYGRDIKAIDGTTVKMADTEANQEEFPQHSNQKKGVGFPIARLLIIVSLTVGTILDYSVGACKGKGTGEHALFRRISGSIKKNDIVLADRYFPSFFFIADLQKIGADGIFRAQTQRNYDFRTGEKLGKNDHVVKWTKPVKPDWMSQVEYDACPGEIKVREFKVGDGIYVTTFLDSNKYHKRELSNIYKLRWKIEINLDLIFRGFKAV